MSKTKYSQFSKSASSDVFANSEGTSVPAGWRRIEPGTFLMGSPESGDGSYDDKGEQHEMVISHPFLLQSTPVTQSEWFKLMGTEPWYCDEFGSEAPVEGVSWYDAVYYCNALSRSQNLEECYIFKGLKGEVGEDLTIDVVEFKGLGCPGYRLPTEAEWEYAARAGSDGSRHASKLDDIAWYKGNTDETTYPVGQKDANLWGLYDMLGNVWEWCWDWEEDYSSKSQKDSMGPNTGSVRILRGGSWQNGAHRCCSASRRSCDPDVRDDDAGFRLARSLEI